jgi:curved DNA-binding protein CbpA
VLHLAQNGATKRVYFKNGDIVFASSDVGTERLGEVLVRNGKLKRAELDLACKVRETSQLRLGRTLVEMGYVSEGELESMVKSQVESILLSMLPWHEGSYRTELCDDPLATQDRDLLREDISTENILLELVRRLDDGAAVRAGIGDLAAPLRFARDPVWVGANLALTTEEGFVLSRVDGASSASEIATLSPMGEDETMRCICALVVSGVLELDPAALRHGGDSLPLQTQPPPVETPPSTSRDAADAPAPPVETVMSPEARQFQEEMLRRHASAHEVTYYELLDLEPTASSEQVKAAYFRLAKRLHPDHRAGLKIHDPDGVFDDLYLAVKAAYEVLSSETERRRYDFSLDKTRRAKSSRVAAEPPPSSNTSTKKPTTAATAQPGGPPARTYDAKQMARLHFANGQRYFNEKRFHEAVEELQDATRLDGSRAEYHRLLGHALGQNPKWRRRAENHFLKALEIDRFDIDTMLALGDMYEAGGMEQRARKIYEEALGLDPGNRRAVERLRGEARGSALDKLKELLQRKDH